MNVSELLADLFFIMMASSHIYNGNRDDCKVLSDAYGRTVVSCRNFACKHRLMHSTISITEATFDDNSQIVAVLSDNVPVFQYGKRSRYSVTPDEYRFLSDNTAWQADIHFLAISAAEGKLL